MEIIKRAKGDSGGEVIAFNENAGNVREEAVRRGSKAGYCTKYGEPVDSGRIISKPATRKYRENYVRIFGHE